jgi:hypothetical protein
MSLDPYTELLKPREMEGRLIEVAEIGIHRELIEFF